MRGQCRPAGAVRTLTLFLFFFNYGIHSLMFGGYPPTAIGYPPTAIGYPPTAIGYPPTAIVGRIGHSEFFFFNTPPPGAAQTRLQTYAAPRCKPPNESQEPVVFRQKNKQPGAPRRSNRSCVCRTRGVGACRPVPRAVSRCGVRCGAVPCCAGQCSVAPPQTPTASLCTSTRPPTCGGMGWGVDDGGVVLRCVGLSPDQKNAIDSS